MNSTTARLGALAGAAALVLTIIWFIAIIQPQSHRLKAAHAAHAAAVAQAQTLTSQVASLQALEKQIPQDKAALGVLKQAVPDTPDLSDALGQLHNAASASGVQLTQVSPTPPTQTSASSSSGSSTSGSSTSGTSSPQASGPLFVNVSMTGTGTYQQLVAFLKLLDNMARTVVVNQIGIASAATGPNGNALTVSLNTQLFYA
jgi:Tfp pilus assembly protein PilO